MVALAVLGLLKMRNSKHAEEEGKREVFTQPRFVVVSIYTVPSRTSV